MIEKWVDIKGYENKYAISNLGRIKSIKANLIMKPMKCTNGYLCACLWKNNKQQKILVHRLVALHFINNPQNYEDVNHIDENKENNQVDNLQWCSHKFNMNYGKDLSKADVSINIMCFLMAQTKNKIIKTSCAIGDTMIEIDGEQFLYAKIVETARDWISQIGGFEKLAEWGLF